jgi:hypothetical protein
MKLVKIFGVIFGLCLVGSLIYYWTNPPQKQSVATDSTSVLCDTVCVDSSACHVDSICVDSAR